MIRAVLDANVFVSAVINPRGVPASLLRAWRDGRFQLVVSGAILKEIAQVLRYPKIRRHHQWSERPMETFLEDLSHLAIRAAPTQLVSVIAEDPSDNRYLECAVAGDAEFIVSGDQHLLTLKTYQRIALLTPAAFLELLRP